MTNLEMLIWGVAHIAQKHGLNADTDYEDEMEVCIYGGVNVPTLCDAKMLCEEVGIDEDYIDDSDFGIYIFLSDEWMEESANKEYKGDALWKASTDK